MNRFQAIVGPQRLKDVLGNKIGETQLENTQMDDRHSFLPPPSQGL